jgi:hypothetical protein
MVRLDAGGGWAGPLAVAVAFAAAVCALAPAAMARDEDPPEGVRQLLPRGGIPAVFDPQFVTAAEAEMPDSAWVLGVFLNGEARAYDLNLLNHHEIVNDVIGGEPVAPVW